MSRCPQLVFSRVSGVFNPSVRGHTTSTVFNSVVGLSCLDSTDSTADANPPKLAWNQTVTHDSQFAVLYSTALFRYRYEVWLFFTYVCVTAIAGRARLRSFSAVHGSIVQVSYEYDTAALALS